MLLALTVTVAINTPQVYAAKTEADSELPNYKIGDVVVTASRTEQAIKDSPAAVEVITREDLDNMGADSLEQALALTIGVSTLANGMVGNEVSIRGVASNKTLILVDGRRITTENTPQTANAYELHRVNMDDVERIEIVRGAVSSLYGSEAMGGVINIITKRPEKLQSKVSLDWSSKYSNLGLVQDFGKVGRNKDWEIKVGTRFTKVRKITNNTGSTNMHGDKSYVNLDIRKNIGERKHLDLFFDYMKEDLKSITGVRYAKYDNYRTTVGTSFNGRDKKGDYELRFYYTNFKRDHGTRTAAGTLSGFDILEANSYITDGRRSIRVNDDHILTFGGEYRIEDYDGTRVADGSTHTVIREGVTANYGETRLYHGAVYLQDEWMPNDKWLIMPSVRWDYNNEFGNKMTAKIGSTYHISDNTRVKLNIGSAYRAPTASELYMNWFGHMGGGMALLISGNRELKPETALNFDVGLEAERGKTSGKISYFHNKIEDMITTHISMGIIPGHGPGMISKYVNVSEATLKGLELEAKHKIGKHFSIRATHTYLDATDQNGVRLTGRARNRTSLQLMYNESNSGIDATLWNDWLNGYGYTESNKFKQTDASLLNFVVNKKFNDSFSAYFGVNNILDKENDVLNYDGRLWRGGVKWTF